MKEFEAELTLAKAVARETLNNLAAATSPGDYSFDRALPKEMKAAIDRILEDIILKGLAPAGFAFLSEEAGVIAGGREGDMRWVIDPLDGTVNFVRGLGNCAVSIALCRGDEPVFGVIGEFPSGLIAWGGQGFGAFLVDKPLRVSKTNEKSKAVLCSGLPSRFNFSGMSLQRFMDRFRAFGKVRMFGAASLSLLQVAKGAADAYSEQDIMFWDVAAGLALVQGAGGRFDMSPGRFSNSWNVFAGNGLLIDY